MNTPIPRKLLRCGLHRERFALPTRISSLNPMRRALALLLLVGAGSLHAGITYYVDGITGNDGNTGLSGSPVRTIGVGLTKLHAGDTLKIAGSQSYPETGLLLDNIVGTPTTR